MRNAVEEYLKKVIADLRNGLDINAYVRVIICFIYLLVLFFITCMMIWFRRIILSGLNLK